MTDREKEIQELAWRMYKECYIGHIPWENWLKFAEFCLQYSEEQRAADWDNAPHPLKHWLED